MVNNTNNLEQMESDIDTLIHLCYKLISMSATMAPEVQVGEKRYIRRHLDEIKDRYADDRQKE